MTRRLADLTPIHTIREQKARQRAAECASALRSAMAESTQATQVVVQHERVVHNERSAVTQAPEVNVGQVHVRLAYVTVLETRLEAARQLRESKAEAVRVVDQRSHEARSAFAKQHLTQQVVADAAQKQTRACERQQQLRQERGHEEEFLVAWSHKEISGKGES
jgi:hypothetical protein